MGQVEIVVRAEGTFQRVYALKRLHAHYAEDPEVRAMFMDEARIAGLIRHANVVGVLDAGEDASGPFLVMEYVEGVSLAQLQDAVREPLPVTVALEIVRQAADGLHAAHELRSPDGMPLDVVHRDVSPQNVLVGFDGIVRVTDFGIARALDRLTQTAHGCLKGKVGYMSPEQLRFEAVDRRSDLFSLGVVLYELLTGARLYPGDRPTAFRRILEATPRAPSALRPDVPGEVDELVLRLLSKQPAERPSSAREVAEAAAAALRRLPPVPLAAFLEGALPEQRLAQRAMVAEALSDRGGGAAPEGAPTFIEAGRQPGSFQPPERSTRRGSVALSLAGAGVLLLGAAALGVALWSQAGDDVAPVGAPIAPPPTVAEPAVAPAPPPTDEAPEPNPPSVAEGARSDDAPSDDAEGEPDPPDVRPRRPRRSRRPEGSPRLGWGWDER